jgi:hypothetical protein
MSRNTACPTIPNLSRIEIEERETSILFREGGSSMPGTTRAAVACFAVAHSAVLFAGCSEDHSSIEENARKIYRKWCESAQHCDQTGFHDTYKGGVDECVNGYVANLPGNKGSDSSCSDNDEGGCENEISNLECPISMSTDFPASCEKCFEAK